jgi:hypothetical protein
VLVASYAESIGSDIELENHGESLVDAIVAFEDHNAIRLGRSCLLVATKKYALCRAQTR